MSTTITTTTFAGGLTRSGARTIVKMSNGNLLLVYYDGTNAKSKEGVDLSAVASATAATIVAMGSAGDQAFGALFNNTAVSGSEQFIGYHNGAGGPVLYNYSAGAWSLNSTSGPSGGGFVGASGLVYDATHWWFQIGYKSSFAATKTAATSWISQYGTGDAAYNVTAWNGKYLLTTLQGAALNDNSSDSVTAPSGTNFPTDNSIESGITNQTGTSAYNSSLITDSAGNAWLAYVNNTGIVLRMRTPGGSWTAASTISSQTTDKFPNLFADTSGNVWVVYIDGGAGNNIKTRQATNNSGAISLVGSAITLESGSATRLDLQVTERDATTMTYVWTEGTGSPYTIKANTYAVHSTVPGAATVALLSANNTVSAQAFLALNTLPTKHNMLHGRVPIGPYRLTQRPQITDKSSPLFYSLQDEFWVPKSGATVSAAAKMALNQAITRIQYVSNASTGSGTTSLTTNFAAATVGNLLIVLAATAANASPGTSTTPSGYTLVLGPITNTSASPAPVNLYLYYKVAAGGETSVITTNTVASGVTCQVWEFSSLTGWPSNPVDVTASSANQSTTTTPVTGTTAATAQAQELLIGGLSTNSASQLTYTVPTNGFTQETMAWAGASPFFAPNTAALYKLTSATGTASTGVTSSTTKPFAGLVAAFKPAGGSTTSTVSGAATMALLSAGNTKAGAASISLLQAGLTKAGAATVALVNTQTKAGAATIALNALGVTKAGAATIALNAVGNTRSGAASIALLQAGITKSGAATISLKQAGLTVSGAAKIALSATLTRAGAANIALLQAGLTKAGAANVALSATLTKAGAATVALKALGVTVAGAATIALAGANTKSGAATIALKALNVTQSGAASIALLQAGLTRSGAATFALSATLTKAGSATLALKATGVTVSASAKIALSATLTVSGASTIALKALGNTRSGAANIALLQAGLTRSGAANIALFAAGVTRSGAATIALAGGANVKSGAATIALKALGVVRSGAASISLVQAGLTKAGAATVSLSATLTRSGAATISLKSVGLTTSGQATIALKAVGNTKAAQASLALIAAGLTRSGASSISLSATLTKSGAASLSLKAAGLVKSGAAQVALKATLTRSAAATFCLVVFNPNPKIPTGTILLKTVAVAVAILKPVPTAVPLLKTVPTAVIILKTVPTAVIILKPVPGATIK